MKLEAHWITKAIVVFFLLQTSPALAQKSEAKQLHGVQSIGDYVNRENQEQWKATIKSPNIQIFYIHGINQVGPGDSKILIETICKYLKECTVQSLGRLYADGPFAVDQGPPALEYMGRKIWKTKEDWSASAPFIEQFKITDDGRAPIMLNELNWFPLVYPLKCKWLIPSDAALTGPSKDKLDVCSVPRVPDPHNRGRFLQYQWIADSETNELSKLPRHSTLFNHTLKTDTIDWGFADAIMALGPMQEILTSGIRQLLFKSLEADKFDLQGVKPSNNDPEYFFITHSLGSYLSLAALDSDRLGSEIPQHSEFAISAEEKKEIDYFSEHTIGFYFLANQIELLELARLSTPKKPATSAEPTDGTQSSIMHWLIKRQLFIRTQKLTSQAPQIIAWSDPDDLLSWEVPHIKGLTVVNHRARNRSFKIPLLFDWPPSAHDNYASNKKILQTIIKPTQKLQRGN